MTWESSVVVGLVGITFFLFWTSFKLDERHWAIRLLSFLLGWGLILGVVGMLREIVEFDAVGATSVLALLNVIWYGLMWVYFALLAYFIVMWCVDYWRANLKKNKKRFNDE